MIKLTVAYNLPPGAGHEEFIKWRTTTQQRYNMTIPGVIKTDFYVIKSAWKRPSAPYRYISEAYFPDMATYEKAFNNPNYQAALEKSLERIADPLFLLSEEVVTETAL